MFEKSRLVGIILQDIFGTWLDKYESNHAVDGQTDGQKIIEIRTGKIYEFVRSNVVTRDVIERWKLMTRFIIDRL